MEESSEEVENDSQMINIDNQLIQLIAVFIESIGILLAERRTAFYLGIATILTIIIFFMT